MPQETPSAAQASSPATGSITRVQATHEVPDAMRRDVSLLGGLLGQVLQEYGSEGLLADVEALRELTIAALEDTSGETLARAEELVSSFSAERAKEVARAFTSYFLLANLAEEQHRVRTLRTRDGELPLAQQQPTDSVAAAFTHLADEVGEREAERRLKELRFHPVLTAHPTEARRNAITASVRRIGALLDVRDDPRVGPTELAKNRRELLEEIDNMWRTAQLRVSSPSPLDEVRTALGIFDSSFSSVFVQAYRRMDDWLQGEASGAQAPKAPAFIRLGSWIAGDRDGNPNVTATITRKAVAQAADRVLADLEERSRRTGMSLTLDDRYTPPSAKLEALWNRQRQLSEDLAEQAAQHSPGEPHRRVLLAITGRIQATRERNADLAYAVPEELIQDLRVVQDSLVEAGANRAAYGDLQELIWQVQTFGFHLAELEVRQHSKVHAQTLAWLEDPASVEKMAVPGEEVLETFRAIASVQQRYGVDAARRYIVSFTQSAQNLADVYTLAEKALGGAENAPVLDVIPLFETYEDLRNAPEILEEMLTHPAVQARLEQTGRRMEVMLGYSDSAKDVGPVSATLALYEAQEKISAWGIKHDITLTQFHGRGGALGRGGGPANRAILAQPPHSVDLRFKVTEQGEVISARYGNPEIALRHIEQVAAATLMASAPSTERRNAEAAQRYSGLAEQMDSVSRERFHGLVNAEGFAPWFAEVTPQDEVGLLAIGSRPAKRGLSVESLEDLRAIPWNFAWGQARINLTGWYGLGSALEAVQDLAQLRQAYAEWPLFRALIDNIEMSLAKTDRRIAERYLALGDREDLTAVVLEEFDLTSKWVLAITDQPRLLQKHQVLGRAVQLRNPYVDALSLIQLRALRVLRSGKLTDEEIDDPRNLLLITLKGVAAGLQNTG
ncbi:phosphoenolpyruvate carboxylase [Nesterenkonia sp. E16_7]|uniref:phosphoenolpyruvate carboxylase n=1 Tax=unclassified Nesterenkonia TaxID=2629769 RepID=UPI001A91837C|nr:MULTISPECIES: phosphoenolpyruvate carboxylase [unclassified Nesterenkonia]MBO0594415.1 phosphoenolpyruvate carboxylase [Nesterenkonia sp. E16_10]MBO0598306.1 phosphoenolpyruvate carboxylase [Nesterenkonia sp. E16_7]